MPFSSLLSGYFLFVLSVSFSPFSVFRWIKYFLVFYFISSISLLALFFYFCFCCSCSKILIFIFNLSQSTSKQRYTIYMWHKSLRTVYSKYPFTLLLSFTLLLPYFYIFICIILSKCELFYKKRKSNQTYF